MDWIQKKQEFLENFNELNNSQSRVNQLISDINKDVGSYINTAGLSSDTQTNPTLQSIDNKVKEINNIKQQYTALNINIQNFLTDLAKKTDWNEQLIENGTIQRELNKLEKIEKEMKVDVDSALARDELLRTRNTNITKHDLFIFNHPVRRSIVPYLWVISVLFIGIGLLIFRAAFPMFDFQNLQGYPSPTTSLYYTLYGFFSNRIVIISLLVSTLFVIIFLSLKVAGVF